MFFFNLSFILCCCSIKIRHSDQDNSLMFQQNKAGEIWLSSLHSAQQIKITDYKYEGDTLIIAYKRGLFCTPNNVLPLNDYTKYLKCANKLFKVEKNNKKYDLIEMN